MENLIFIILIAEIRLITMITWMKWFMKAGTVKLLVMSNGRPMAETLYGIFSLRKYWRTLAWLFLGHSKILVQRPLWLKTHFPLDTIITLLWWIVSWQSLICKLWFDNLNLNLTIKFLNILFLYDCQILKLSMSDIYGGLAYPSEGSIKFATFF